MSVLILMESSVLYSLLMSTMFNMSRVEPLTPPKESNGVDD